MRSGIKRGNIFECYVAIARACLNTALQDCKRPDQWEDAMSFIKSSWCETVCSVADINYDDLVKKSKKLIYEGIKKEITSERVSKSDEVKKFAKVLGAK